MRKGIIVLILLLFGLPQMLMAASESNVAPLEFRLDQITVFGEKEAEMSRTASVNNIVVNEEIIDSTPGDNLGALLQQQGFMVLPSGNADGNTFLVVRGFRSDHLGKELDGRVLVMIDGRRSGASDIATISLLNVERVEILRGPEMLQYSSAYSGGIVNVVTKRPKGEEAMSGMVEGGMGTDGYYKGQVAANGATSGFDYSMGYRYTESDDFHDGGGNKVKYSSTDHMNSFSGNLGYTFMDNHRIGINSYYYKVDKAHKPAYTDQLGFYHNANYSDKENWFVNFSYDGQTPTGDWTWDASYSRGENSVESYTAAGVTNITDPPFAHYYDTQTAQARTTYHGGIFDISTGFQWFQYGVKLSERGGVNAGKHPSSTTTNYGTYVMGRLFLLDSSLILSSALRYDYYNVSDDGKGRVVRRQETNHNTDFDGLSPSFGIAYLPLDWLKLRANYTRGFRAPSGRELVEDRQYNYWGNPGNKAEKTDTYETGFDIMADAFNFSGTLFYSYTKNYIYQHTYYPPGFNTPDHARVQNADKQIRSGIEAQTSVDIAKLMNWDDFVVRPSFTLNYMFSNKEKFRSYQSWTSNSMQRVPKYTLATGLYFSHIPSELKINLTAAYIGRYNQTIGSPLYSSRKRMDTGNYWLVNGSLEKRLFDFGEYGDLSLKAEVCNLLDEKYIGSNSYYMPGRTFYMGAIYRF